MSLWRARLVTGPRSACFKAYHVAPVRQVDQPQAEREGMAEMTQAVDSGRISQSRLRDALARIIRLKVALGLLTLPAS